MNSEIPMDTNNTNGDSSPTSQEEADTIADREPLVILCEYKESKGKGRKVLVALGIAILFVILDLFVFQANPKPENVKIFWVQFQDSTGLDEYSGCFEINNASSSLYHSYDTGPLSTTFGYCAQDQQWIFFRGKITDPCRVLYYEGDIEEYEKWLGMNEEDVVLARSSKTETLDISTVFDKLWFSGTFISDDLKFLEFDTMDQCITLDDGVCDRAFNENEFSFDSGDCCAATCTKPNCGKGGLTSVFGNSEVSGDGYENCVDPNMVPITIHLNAITSSRDPVFTGWKQLSDTEAQVWEWGNDQNQFIEWMEVEPAKAYLSLDCNGNNVMTAYLDKSMVNQSQMVMVEDGAKCTLVIRGTLTTRDIVQDDPIWYIDYTVFHGVQHGVNGIKEVKILSGNSSSVETVDFTRIPECYFEKLGNIYTGDLATKQAINWLLEDPDPNQQCDEDSNFREKYALVKMNFATNPTKSFITRDELCKWLSVSCSLFGDKIVGIFMPYQGLEGALPSEIGLISDLNELHLYLNEFESLPTEIGNLSSLEILDLADNNLQSLPTEIGSLSSLQLLDLSGNELTSLPTEIGSLSSLQILNLDINNLGSLPTEIGSLSSLQLLDLSGNELGSLPTEIGNLSSLQWLGLDHNQLTSLPTEIWNLSSLQMLNLADNKLQSLPPEIGNLSSLQELYLYSNELQSLPTEIGNLTSLQMLQIEPLYRTYKTSKMILDYDMAI